MSKHLRDKKKSYSSHFKFAFGAGIVLLLAGLASVIHAIFPDIFVGYSERKTHALSKLAKRRHDKF